MTFSTLFHVNVFEHLFSILPATVHMCGVVHSLDIAHCLDCYNTTNKPYNVAQREGKVISLSYEV